MMLRHLEVEAADLIIKSIENTISEKNVTYDFARLMDDANQVSCSGFGDCLKKICNQPSPELVMLETFSLCIHQ